MVHCLFEQSGVFKNQFIELGYNAKDYDIEDKFNETNYICNIFDEIEKAWNHLPSIFDDITTDDLILAFFPCIRFSHVAQMLFKQNAPQYNNCNCLDLMRNDMKFHDELHIYYITLCKLVYICYSKGFHLVIENPYDSQHYLVKYWSIPACIIDMDRRNDGDYYKKPTQYFFINFKPYNNFLFEPIPIINNTKKIMSESGFNRSLISPMYANRFIRKYLIPGE